MSMTNISTIAAGSLATAIVNRKQLADALDAVSRVVEKRNTVAVLGNVRLKANGADTIAVIGTDLTMEIEIEVGAEAVDSRFDVTVPCARLAALTNKASPSATLVTLTATIGTMTQAHFDNLSSYADMDISAACTARFGEVDYKLSAIQSVALPRLQLADNMVPFPMSGTSFHAALDKVRGAMSTEETRYYLNGMFIHLQGDDIRFAATDGHRLYVQSYEAPADAAGLRPGIVPRKAINTIHALTKGKACPNSFDLELSDTGFVCRFGSTVIRSKTIDGTFPDYQRVMPIDNPNLANFDSEALISAIKSVALIAENSKPVVRVTIEDNSCTLLVKYEDDSATSPVPGGFDSENLEFGANVKYLIDAIDVACPGGERVFFRINDGGSPIVIRGTSPRFTVALMPTRV